MQLKKLLNTVKGFDGKDVKIPVEGGEAKTIIIKDVLASTVASGFERATAIESVKCYQIAVKLNDEKDELEVSAEDVSIIKRALEANRNQWTPFVIGQVLLETGLEIIEKSV